MNESFLPYLNTQTNSNCSFSFLTIEKLIDWAGEKNFSFLSIADYFPYSSLDFFSICKQKKIKPVWGVKFFCRSEKEERKIPVTAFPLNYEGYKNIIKTLFSANSSFERVFFLEQTFSLLSKNCFLVLELDCVEKIKQFSNWWTTLSFKKAVEYKNVFLGFNFFLLSPKKNIPEEIWDKLLPFFPFKFLEVQEEQALNCFKKTCFSNNYFAEDRQLGYKYSASKEEFLSFCTDDESFFQFLLTRVDLFVSLIEINVDSLLKKKVIKINVLKQEESFLELKNQCFSKLEFLVANYPSEEKERYFCVLKKELEIVKKMDYCDYLLTFRNVVAFLKEKKSITNFGRGSAVSSLIVFLLGITKVDPLKHGLFFERFLNDKRKTLADIDLDVEDQKLVFDFLNSKYDGIQKKKLARLIIRKKIGIKGALNELVKLLKLSEEDLKPVLSKEWDLSSNQIRPWKLRFPQLFYLLEKINVLYWDVQLHPSGIIISEKSLENVPLAFFQDYPVVFWEEKKLNELGLKKYDFLSLKETFSFLKFARDSLSIADLNDCSEVDLNDKKTWDLLDNGLLTGIFQLGTLSASALFVKIRPKCFSELVSFLALNRPGTVERVNEIIRQKETGYVPNISICLQKILNETKYCILFEEQISQILSLVYNCSFSEAELIRRNFKNSLPEKDVFFSQAEEVSTQLSISDLEWIYNQLPSLMLFNKAHAVAYGFLTYYCAYLKANYFDKLVVYWLNNNVGKIVSSYLEEAFFLDYEIILPEINISFLHWISNDKRLVLGFSSLRGFQEVFFLNVIIEREKGGTFLNMETFLERTFNWWDKVEVSLLENWVELGLFRSLGLEMKSWDNYSVLLFVRLKKIFPDFKENIPLPVFRKSSLKEKKVIDFWLVNEREYFSLGFFVSFFSRWRENFFRKSMNSSFEILIKKRKEESNELFLIYAILLGIKKIIKETKSMSRVLYKLQLWDVRGEFSVFLSEGVFQKRKERLFNYNEMFFLLQKIWNDQRTVHLFCVDIIIS